MQYITIVLGEIKSNKTNTKEEVNTFNSKLILEKYQHSESGDAEMVSLSFAWSQPTSNEEHMLLYQHSTHRNALPKQC